MNEHLLIVIVTIYKYIISYVCEQILVGHCFMMFENQHMIEKIIILMQFEMK